MKYLEFKNTVKDWPIVSDKLLAPYYANKQVMRNQISSWVRKGLLIKLKKGIYLLNENDRLITPSNMFIANQLYTPSYVSLETAMSFYGIIPEAVADVTSVTTKKTARFRTPLGVFVYQHIKPEAFRGFIAVKDNNGYDVFLAMPEKAIVDFFYLNMHRFTPVNKDIFENSFRFQNLEDISCQRVQEFSRLFNSPKLSRICDSFCEYVTEETRLD